jgi:hypothetical protein
MKTPEQIRQIVDNAINTAMGEIQGMIDPENLTDSGMHCELYFDHKGAEYRRLSRIMETYAMALDIAQQNSQNRLNGTGSEAQDRANREWNEKARNENNPRS